jgi:hypothetical protein
VLLMMVNGIVGVSRFCPFLPFCTSTLKTINDPTDYIACTITCWLLIVYTHCLMHCLAALWLTMTHSLDSDLYIRPSSIETQALSLFSLCNIGLQRCFPEVYSDLNCLRQTVRQSISVISYVSLLICPACKGLLSDFKNKWLTNTVTCRW